MYMRDIQGYPGLSYICLRGHSKTTGGQIPPKNNTFSVHSTILRMNEWIYHDINEGKKCNQMQQRTTFSHDDYCNDLKISHSIPSLTLTPRYCCFSKEVPTLLVGKSGTGCRDSGWEELSFFRNYFHLVLYIPKASTVCSLNVVTVPVILVCLVSVTVLGTQQVLQNIVH